MKYTIYTLMFLFVLASCKSQKEQPKTKEPVKNEAVKLSTKFDMKELVGAYQIQQMQEMEVIEGENPYMTILESNKISGFNGCNNFFGTILPSSEELLFDKLGSTRMACEGEKEEVERVFMSTMAKVTSARIVGENILELLAEDIVVLKGTKIILRDEYRILTFQGENVESIGMNFNVSEIRANGNTGCNSFSCQFYQDGFTLDISEISATERACEKFDSKLESEFLSIIQVVKRFSVKDNLYTFYEGNKVVFTAIKE